MLNTHLPSSCGRADDYASMVLAGKGVVFTSSETEFLTAGELVLATSPRICLVHTNDYNVWLTEVTVTNTWGR